MASHLSICLCSVQSGFLDWYPFDPAKLDSPANQEKEVKNGRLAMVSYMSCSSIVAVQMHHWERHLHMGAKVNVVCR